MPCPSFSTALQGLEEIPTTMLAILTVAERFTIVDAIGTPGEGGTLAGLNVHSLPAGVMVFVAGINRLYQLRKDLPIAVIPDVTDFANVVAAVGSSHTAGYFVACTQMGTVTLSGGEGTVSGFDLSRSGKCLSSLVTAGGTLGKYVLYTPQDDATLAVQSESSDDAGTYFFTYIETPA